MCDVIWDSNKMIFGEENIESISLQNHTFKCIFDDVSVCIVIVNKFGNIRMVNKAYADFLGVEREEVIGKDVTKVIDNTRLHIILQTGKPEIGQIQRLRGHDAITDRIPIIEDGKVIGAIGKVIFKDMQEVNTMYKKLETLRAELNYHKEQGKENSFTLKDIIGDNYKMVELKATALRVAQFDSTVLITGESGTGKEGFANAIHELSKRKGQNFVKINCAAIPENILEAELFGYEEGAFTGAKHGGKIGKFELAHRGTIFLDEIGDMSFTTQSKILRVLQEKEIERVGGNGRKKIDVRIIAATNQNLFEKIIEGKFREDLYYRLNVLAFEIPPLRERSDDVRQLCYFFLKKYNEKFGTDIEKIDEEVLDCLEKYKWPGNVRELENTIERAFAYANDNIIKKEHLPKKMVKDNPDIPIGHLGIMLEGYEKQIIFKALETYGWNKSKTSKALGINRANLYKKMKKYNIYGG
ncbi:sigma-54 interaction domain-containing protein [Sinanaerobacter chloroacetimidivorans]|jgi:transcriptional regulator with PAS, ATPase and Fis domain|uniref:Sigma 54-interacting transcriptional regulator n=1 Tax=Sinanaerobacter chloroacetimidivorans TaxID=2818044 RepID=A0A8J7W3J8_9FIRM|nr:sigma 54-interacting transcriptional regulator [Sinanaerobacter chloroacetimidivorans]MBR0598605.1 sigma 54-interacting transcriptional regulator [Sinanaerobacter chloroacetimidivorans]